MLELRPQSILYMISARILEQKKDPIPGTPIRQSKDFQLTSAALKQAPKLPISNTKKLVSTIASLILFILSCTDLSIQNTVDTLPQDYLNTPEDYALFIAPAYLPLQRLTAVGSWLGVQEISTDEACAPLRGFQWSDQEWVLLHRHQWQANNPMIRETWSVLYEGVNECNRLIHALEMLADDARQPHVAELRTLRAYYYMLLIDGYGDVPLVTDFAETDPPIQMPRDQVFSFIETELLETKDLLSKEVNANTYGKITSFAAQAILVNLYLNAVVYSGSERWSSCIAAADIIIESGNFRLTEDYFDNFRVDNQHSAEIIFAVPYDEQFAPGFNLNMATLHSDSKHTYNLESQPWNGWCTLEDFFNSYQNHDLRRGEGTFPGSFIYGQQFTASGDTLRQDTSFIPLESSDPDGLPVFLSPQIRSLDTALLQDGARIGKFEIEMGAKHNMNNDFPLFRYARIIMNKAEALWRLGRTAEALGLFNQVRLRIGLSPAIELSDDIWLAELGKEFFMEAHRRSDLIRFSRFNGSWWEKESSDRCKNLFPIPQEQIEENPSLVQNPCY